MSSILTLHNPHSTRAYYLSGIWLPDTMYALLARHAATRGQAWAVRDAHQRLSWAELLAVTDAVAADLHQAGLRPGDRVSVWLPSRVEMVAVFLACSRNGYVYNPLHENYTVEDVVGLLERVQCRAVFAQAGHGADAARRDIFGRLTRLASLRVVYDLGASAGGAPQYGQRRFPETLPASNLPPPSNDPDQVVYLAFTAGTTGEPKGVMHSDNTLLANARSLVTDWQRDEHAVILTLSPMGQHIGVVALQQTLVAGCELVMTERRAGIAPLDWIEQTGATYVMGVPTHAIDLLRAMSERGQPGMGQVSMFYMAGAPIPREVSARLLQLGITPLNVYGMTENGSHHYTRPGDDVRTITATCGRISRGYEVRLWQTDDPDVECAPGEVGEIGGRGGVLMLGYFSDQAATEQSFNATGWFMSGDLGQFDDQGNLLVVGRKKDVINRGGNKIHPARIEHMALRHPGVGRAAVFGLPDDRLGERVCIAVIGHGATPSADALLEHLARLGLARFETPEYVAVTDVFPLTASGKVVKHELVEWVRCGRLQPEPVRRASALQEP